MRGSNPQLYPLDKASVFLNVAGRYVNKLKYIIPVALPLWAVFGSKTERQTPKLTTDTDTTQICNSRVDADWVDLVQQKL